jgi:hypothetical protein
MAIGKIKADGTLESVADVGYRSNDSLVNEVNRLSSLLLNGAKLIENVSVGTADTRLWHNLGRQIKGWIVVRRTSAVEPYEGTSSAEQGAYINLRAASAVIVTLVVF